MVKKGASIRADLVKISGEDGNFWSPKLWKTTTVFCSKGLVTTQKETPFLKWWQRLPGWNVALKRDEFKRNRWSSWVISARHARLLSVQNGAFLVQFFSVEENSRTRKTGTILRDKYCDGERTMEPKAVQAPETVP